MTMTNNNTMTSRRPRQLDIILALCAAISNGGKGVYNLTPTEALTEVSAAWGNVKTQANMVDLIANHNARDFTADLAMAWVTNCTAENYDKSAAAVAGTVIAIEISTAAALYRAAMSQEGEDIGCTYGQAVLAAALMRLAMNDEILVIDDTQTN